MDKTITAPRPGLPRGGLPSGEGIDAVIFWIALALAALFSIAEVVFAATYVPVMLYTYDKMGLEPTFLLSVGDQLGPVGIVLALSAIDLVLFVVCAWAARRYWIGLLFVSPLFYLLIAFIVFAAGFSGFPALIQ